MATLPNNASRDPSKPPRDNLLGVCASLGEITGIDPIVFRIGFVLAILGLTFEITIGAYLIAAVAFYVARR